MDLLTATKLAERIAAELTPFCERLAIAGSIRRRRPECKDIDLVALVKPGQERALRYRALQNTQAIREGDDLMAVRLKNGVQVDLFFASHFEEDMFGRTPGTWGTVMLCRTGSAAHNMHLAATAKRRGMHWNPHHGVFGRCPRTGREGTCLAAATEEEIFQVLQLDFVAPEKRER